MAQQDRNLDNPLLAEHQAMDEAEGINPHFVDEANPHETEALAIEQGAGAVAALPAEAAAIHTDTEAALEASGDLADDGQVGESTDVEPAATVKASTARSRRVAQTKKVPAPRSGRSRRYLTLASRVDQRRNYAPKEALALAQATSATKFDSAMEVHIRLVAKKGKDSSERYRALVFLPHGTGKALKIGVLDEALIAEIKQRGSTDFEILLASPALMPKVAQIAKILGPQGKMPNPKTGTVTDDPLAAKQAIGSGRVEIRADAQHNLHQIIGRVSWPLEKLLANYQALLASLPAARLQRVTVASTMGPGIYVDFNK